MLSRTADNLYWLSAIRGTRRISCANSRSDSPPFGAATRLIGTSNEWESAVANRRLQRRFLHGLRRGKRGQPSPTSCLLDGQHLIHSFLLRTRPRQRPCCAHTRSLWKCGIRSTPPGLSSSASAMARLRVRNSRASCGGFRRSSLRFDGSAYRTMLRNDAYWFSLLGVYTNVADNTARILDVRIPSSPARDERVGGPLDYFQWAAILRSVSAHTAYHWVNRESLKPWLVADLLILREEMPRSLCVLLRGHRSQSRFARYRLMAVRVPAQRHARGIRTRPSEQPDGRNISAGMHGCHSANSLPKTTVWACW